MTEDDFLPEVFVNFKIEFKAIRVIDSRLIPTRWKLKVEVIDDDTREEDDESYDAEIEIALAKIRFWFDNFVNGSVILNRENDWAQRAFLSDEGTQSVDNHLVILPEEPTDAILAAIFQSKMNALADFALTFGTVELESDDADGLSFVFIGSGEQGLPTMDEWVGERTFFSKPWWSRGDGSTIDVIPDEEDDITKVPAFATSLDFIAEALHPTEIQVARIVRPEFRPAVIDGGKKD